MEVDVLYAGVPIGTVTLDSPSGLAYGWLRSSAAYELARAAAEEAGLTLAPRRLEWRYWPASRGDFADAFAAAVAGGYELMDARGVPVGAASVAVLPGRLASTSRSSSWTFAPMPHACGP